MRDSHKLALFAAMLLMLYPCGVGAQSQEAASITERAVLPDAPKPKVNRRVFLAGVGLLAASKGADVWTTKALLGRGGWENNASAGRHPSTVHLAGHAAMMLAGQSTAFYLTERSRHSWVRWVGRAYVGLAVEEHARLAACNARLNTHAPAAQNCRSFLPF